jgi:Zn-dependent protease with chaperone function
MLMALTGILFAGGSWAADPPTPASSLTPRAKLDRLLACQQAEKDAALAEKRKAEKNIANIESFRLSLSDRPVHVAAHERANRALTLAREALAKIDERIQLADRKTGMTVRALQYLVPEQEGVQESSPATDAPRRKLNRLADGENASLEVDNDAAKKYGFVTDPALTQRMTALVNRLQMLSSNPDVPIQVRVLEKESGYGAFATATTVYVDKAYLDKNPSESELLFIASHELAHVQLGHFSETIVGQKSDAQRLSKDLGPEGWDAIGRRTEEALLKMRTGPWEQRQEEAADLLGAQQALEAGASPKGIHDAMLRMDEEEKTWAHKVAPDIQRYRDSLRDHAKPLDRLKTLESVLGDKFWERTDLKFGAPCHRP